MSEPSSLFPSPIPTGHRRAICETPVPLGGGPPLKPPPLLGNLCDPSPFMDPPMLYFSTTRKTRPANHPRRQTHVEGTADEPADSVASAHWSGRTALLDLYPPLLFVLRAREVEPVAAHCSMKLAFAVGLNLGHKSWSAIGLNIGQASHGPPLASIKAPPATTHQWPQSKSANHGPPLA